MTSSEDRKGKKRISLHLTTNTLATGNITVFIESSLEDVLSFAHYDLFWLVRAVTFLFVSAIYVNQIIG